MTSRREFITLLGGAAAAWPLGARAQQAAMHHQPTGSPPALSSKARQATGDEALAYKRPNFFHRPRRGAWAAKSEGEVLVLANDTPRGFFLSLKSTIS